MPSPWDSRLAATFGVRRAQIDKAAAWAADAVDAVVRKHWARLGKLARGGGPFNHVYTMAREIIGQMNADVAAVVTARLYNAADWSYSTAVDAMLTALPTEAYRWIVAERLFNPQLQEQEAWPPKLTKAQRRNLDFEARALGFNTVDEYLESLLRLLPSDMDDSAKYAAMRTLIRDTHGKLPPDRVTSFQPKGKPATIVLGRPDSLSKWWAAGFHKMPRAQQQEVLRQFVFDPPTKAQVKAIVEKRTGFAGKPPMSYHERLEMLSHTITDKDVLARKFASSVSAGDLPRDTMLAILPQVNGGKVSAQRIARTELARVANGMAEETFADCADVIDGYQIHAIMDVVTRPEHAARNGRIWYVNGVPPASERPTLPDSYNCFPAGTVMQGRIVAGLKSLYSGEFVELVTAGGNRLTVTVNHPILTEHGFVAANTIKNGDNLVCYKRRDVAMSASDDQYKPTVIEKIFESLRESSTIMRRPVASSDLHGDGRFVEGDIEIVGAGRPLLDRFDSASAEFFDDGQFRGADSDLLGESRLGPLNHSLNGISVSTTANMGGGSLGGALLGTHLRPLEQFRFGPAAQIDASLSKPAGNGRSADSEFVAKLLYRHAGSVSVDKVIDIRTVYGTRHVYDLQSEGGWNVANNIFVSNCRCYYSPVLKQPESIKKNPELLKAYRDNAGPIQDPLVYSQWWDRASDEERRTVVGSRRYDAVAQKIAGASKPKFEDFVSPETGELIKTDQLRGEDLAAFAERRQKNAEAFQARAALLRQTAEKSFLDVPTSGGNPPPVKPTPKPKPPLPPAKGREKPIKPKKEAPPPKEQWSVPDAEKKAIAAARGIKAKLDAFTTGDKIVAQLVKAGRTATAESDAAVAELRAAGAEYRAVNEQWQVLQDEIRTTRGKKRQALLAKADELRPKWDAASKRFAAASTAEEAASKRLRQLTLAALTSPDPQEIRGVDVSIDAGFAANAKRKHEIAKEWFDAVLASNGPTGGKVFIESRKLTPGERAHHQAGRINVGDASSTETIVHEIGHELNERGDVRDAAKDFLTYRMMGDTGTYPMGTTAGRPGEWKNEESRGVDDFEKLYRALGMDASTAKYNAAYTGRHYADQSEVVSMGVESLYQNAAAFAEADPEFCKFIIAVLRGVMK